MDLDQKKILSTLTLANKWMMIKDIALNSGINRHAVARKLDVLEIMGRVRKIEIGSAKKYSIVQAIPVSSLIDISNDLIIILNERWEVQYINKAALVFFNLVEHLVIGKRMDCFHLDIFSLPEVIQGLQEFSFQRVSKIEVSITKEGIDLWYEISIMNISLRPGSVSIAITASNITEKIKTRIKLIENEAMYRSLFENAPIPINEADFSQVKEYIDELQRTGVYDLRSYFENSTDELKHCLSLITVRTINIKSQKDYQVTNGDYSQILSHFIPLLSGETLSSFTDLLISLYNGADFFNFPSTLHTSQGIPRYFSNFVTVASPLHDLSRVYISYLDVTEQKSLQLQAQKSHRELISVTEEVIARDTQNKELIDALLKEKTDATRMNRLYEQLLNATQMPMIIFDDTRIIIWISSRMSEFCGYSDSFLIGKTIDIVFPETLNSTDIVHIIERIAKPGRSTPVSLINQSGGIHHVHLQYVDMILTSAGKEHYAILLREPLIHSEVVFHTGLDKS